MTEQEVFDWLGLTPADVNGRHLKQRVLDGMAEVPAPPPGPTNTHLDVMRAWLQCAGEPTGILDIWEPRHYAHPRIVFTESTTGEVTVEQDGRLTWEGYSANMMDYIHRVCPHGTPVIIEYHIRPVT